MEKEFTLHDSSVDSSLEELRSTPDQNVIFGAGDVGLLVLGACWNAGIEVVALCDNSSEKIGLYAKGVPIFSPEEVLKRYP